MTVAISLGWAGIDDNYLFYRRAYQFAHVIQLANDLGVQVDGQAAGLWHVACIPRILLLTAEK